MVLKYLGTDEDVWGSKVEHYSIATKEINNKGIPIEFVIGKETMGAYDENGNEQIGIGGRVFVICDRYTNKIKKIIEKQYETIKLNKNMFSTETYVSPSKLDDIFNCYVKAIKEVVK